MRRLVNDTLIIAERNLVRLPRAPDLLLAFTVQPIMFFLLFVYVFGGAIQTPGFDNYKDFMLPGIVVQNVAFGGFVTALGLNEDLSKGLIDRFRSLPMSRAAVLAGRTLADIVTNLLSLMIIVVTGLIIGFSFHTSAPEVLLGVLLMVLFGYAFSWIFALLGMLVSSPEAANSVGFIAVFPLTFISSAFVPTDSMPAGWRRSRTSTRSPSSSTRCARCGWARPPGTTCGARSPGRSACWSSSRRSRCAATGSPPGAPRSRRGPAASSRTSGRRGR